MLPNSNFAIFIPSERRLRIWVDSCLMKLDQSEVRRAQQADKHPAEKAPTQSLRQAQKQATHRAIVRAARACFLSCGVAKTTFDDIAARAGVSRATVYLYFSSKEHLLLGMLEEDWDAQCGLFALLPASARSPDEFAKWLRQVIGGYQTRRASMGLYAMALAKFPELSERVDVQRERLVATLGQRFPAFEMTAETPMEKRVDAHLMIVQLEHVCLMAIRGYADDAVQAAIGLVSRRLAAFIAAP